MLKKFTVGNFLSFYHHQSFTLSSAGFVRVVHTPHCSVNQFSALFGKNKEHLLEAINFASQRILFGLDNSLPPMHFQSHQIHEHTLSSFDFEISVGESLYSIGFEIDTTNNKIVEQWLIDIEKGKKEILYYIHTTTGNYTYKEGFFSLEEFTSIVNNKDTNSSIISSVMKNTSAFENNEERSYIFKNILNWFKHITIIHGPALDKKEGTYTLPLHHNLFEVSLIFDGNIKQLPEANVLQLEKLIKKETQENIIIFHNSSLYMRFKPIDRAVWFEPIYDTTNREFAFLIFLLLTKSKSSLLLINNLEKLLSPPLTHQCIKKLFSISELKSLQCIITSEENSLLDLNLLKKNEIWFISAGEYNASRLISYDCFFFEEDKDIALAYKNGEFDSF